MSESLAQWQTRVLETLRAGASHEGLFRGECLDSRVAFYQDGYGLRVRESLADDFPLTARLLGATRFEAARERFIAVRRAGDLELGAASPAFAAWLGSGAAPALARALLVDLAAFSARVAPEPAAREGGEAYGLHPSVRFSGEGRHLLVLWRADGEVLRERIDARGLRLLEVFRKPAPLAALGERLGGLGESAAYVQEAVAEWMEAGVLCRFPG